MTDLEPTAHLKFKAVDVTPETTLEDWLDMAKNEFALKQLAINLIRYDDAQLAKRVRKGGDPNEWLELANAFDDLRKRECGAEVCGACYARLFIVLEREFGEK